MTDDANNTRDRWVQAWPDALAFGGGLAVAWFAGWETTDLVWSLWLSSLVVGYAMIVWSIFGPAVFIGSKAWEHRAELPGAIALPAVFGGLAFLFGGLFMLAFFTVHFGMFHYVHSVFLESFFPVLANSGKGFPGTPVYLEVLQRYWIFLPVAFLAERQAFRLKPAAPPEPSDTSVTAAAIAARKARNAKKRGMNGGMDAGMMGPYKNVIRLHLLIFFFAFAHFAKLESFLIYAVVYAVYFFPWRLLRRPASAAA